MRNEECYGGNIRRYNPARGANTATHSPKPTMHEVTEAPLLKRAHGAAADGDWQQAYELFVEADARELLDPPDLAVFANCAYAAGHVNATIDAWERVHAEGLRAGGHLMAAGAAVRVALHLLFDTALLAPIRGWASRAERLLAGRRTPVHAWIAVVRSYERLLSGDFGRAREWARRAIDVGTGRDPAAAALGRIAEARSLILEGEVARGLDLLNEAAVATMSGELNPLSTGVVYCEVVCAVQAVAQYQTLPSSGRRPWNGGARVSPSEVSTDVAECTARRSSGCVDRVSRPSRKRSALVRSCARTCDENSDGR